MCLRASASFTTDLTSNGLIVCEHFLKTWPRFNVCEVSYFEVDGFDLRVALE